MPTSSKRLDRQVATVILVAIAVIVALAIARAQVPADSSVERLLGAAGSVTVFVGLAVAAIVAFKPRRH